MAPGEQDDELLMSLVEETLQTPAEHREEKLRAVCRDAALLEEVRTRVEWEERMGRFLLDPLFERVPPGDPFAPGSIVGGRFRILRKVGYGGMGVVFEAVDEKLDRRVALKCARPGHRYRLPPEARAAREVSHYNVCKVHDLHTAATDTGELEFLSMEFIEGHTLSERIRGGPIPDAEALSIAKQICAGLAQAHRQGVIHGDLKCSNILLAQSPEGSVRAVITDFGLAKLQHWAGGAVMSGRGGGGTFDYMAPELLLGERATIASDLYALGVLFHILVTGRSPERLSAPPARTPSGDWRASTRASTITMGEAIVPSEWARKVEDLAAPWDRVVHGCMAARPAERFDSATEAERALEPPKSRRKWMAMPVAAVAVAAGVWYWGMQPAGGPVRLAILPFAADADAARTASGIGLDVAERLAGVRRNFTVISPREAQANRVDSAEKARSVFTATHVLQARLRGTGSQVIMEASIADVESGRSVGSIRGSYLAADAPQMAKAILAMATGAFQLRAAPKESVSGAAYAPYVQGLDLMRQDPNGNCDRAIPLFEQAAQLDPHSALPSAGLAEAQIQRYVRHDGAEWLDRAAGSIAKAKSINSDSVKVLLVSGYFEQQHGRYEPAIQDFTRALQLEPANGDALRRLAGAYEAVNRDQDAVTTYRKAIAEQPGDYRQYNAFGGFYFFRNQFQLAEQQYRSVTGLAPGLQTGHMNLGLALIRQGRYPEAEQSLLRALALRKSPSLLMNIGGLYYVWERYPEAAEYFQQSISAGSPSAAQYRDLGDAYRHLGRPDEAAEAYKKAIGICEEDLTRNPRDAGIRVRLGLLAAFTGDARRANFEVSQALSMEPENASVTREAVVAYEFLNEREKSLEALRNSPVQLLEELDRFPDVKDLHQDTKFQELLQQRRK